MRAVTVLLIFFASDSSAQTVKSSGTYSMGQVHDLDWTFEIGNMRFGLSQYRQYQDADGRNLYTFSDTITGGLESFRYTTVYYGLARFTVRLPAWLMAVTLLVISVSAFLLVIGAAHKRIMRSRELNSTRQS